MRGDDRSSEAGLKYFILGARASGILLFGVSLLYGFSGTTDFAGVAAATTGEVDIGLLFGIVFVIAGLAFKISAVPFHMWTPDVYEGAPTPVTTFFASAPKVAAMRSEEHTSELQSLMRISYAVFCLKKKKK